METPNDYVRATSYSTAIIVPVIETATDQGVPLAEILAGTNITPEDLKSPSRMSAAEVVQVYKNCVRCIDNPNFAFLSGQRSHLSCYEMSGFAVLSSRDIGEALSYIERYNSLSFPLSQVSIRQADGHVYVSFALTIIPEDPAFYRFYIDLRLGNLITAIRDIAGPAFSPDTVSVRYGQPADPSARLQITGCPVSYDAPENHFTFAASWLAQRIELGNPVTHAGLVRLCDEFLKDFEHRKTQTRRVREELIANFGRPMSFTELCERLMTSPRTLRRKLREEGASFQDIHSDLRMHMAVRYLRETRFSVEEIASALGFSEAASFRKFLRRNTGKSPSDIRSEPDDPAPGSAP